MRIRIEPSPQKEPNVPDGSSIEKAVKILMLLTVFLLPLFFGLGKINILDFNKQILLLFLSSVILFLWFLTCLSKGKFVFHFSILHLASLAFLATVLISTTLSSWRWGSFWGWPQEATDNFATIGCLFVFYFLFSHLISKKEVASSHSILLASAALISLVGILQLSGQFLFPLSFTKTTSFNPIGTVLSWAIFLGSLLPLNIALIIISKDSKKMFLSIIAILLFLGLFICNNSLIWLVLFIGMAAFLLFALWKSKMPSYKFLVLPAVILSVALALWTLKINIPGLPATPLDVRPSFGATLEASTEMLKESTKNLLFGWGPGTFKYGWSKFKVPSLNQTIFWNVRFSKGGSHIPEMFGTIGAIGSAIYILFIGLAVYLGIKELSALAAKGTSPEWFLMLGVLTSFSVLSVAKILYPVNISLDYLWWFLLANIAILSSKKSKTLELKPDSKESFIFSFLGILILVGGTFFLYLGGTRYLAEIKYVQAFQDNKTFEETKDLILNAIRLNPQEEVFWRDMSQLYLVEANQEILKQDVSDEEKTEKTGELVANAVAMAKRATEINAANVANWQNRGRVYQEIIGWSKGAFEWSVNSYEKALTLEPANPFILVELGKTYLVQANITSEEAEANSYFEKAQDYIKKAIDLKPDYAQAFYQMALIYEAQGKREEAITTLERLKALAPFMADYNPLQDVGLAFQLGILYYLDEGYDEALGEFERAVSLDQNHSNARYFLGLIYDEKGDRIKAIEQFTAIQELNPENEDIKNILANLREGKPALGVSSEMPESVPIENTPEEK